ncbi:MAG: hypothetical protein SF172_16280 [Burkholderiales bacterium]|nr:hypothetical protein [Burkholderiales bacterium]
MTLRRIPSLLCALLLAASASTLQAQTCPAPDESLSPEVREERRKRDAEEISRLSEEIGKRVASSMRQTNQLGDKLINGSTPMEWVLGANQIANRSMIELATRKFTNQEDATKAFQEAIDKQNRNGQLTESDLILERAYLAGKRDPAILFTLTSHCMTQRSGFCNAHPTFADELVALDPDNAWTWLMKAYGQQKDAAQESLRKALATPRFNSYLQPQFVVLRELAKDVPVDTEASIIGPLQQLTNMIPIRPTSALMKSCSEVMAGGLGSGATEPPKPLTPAGETCVALLRHAALNADDEMTAQMSAFMLKMISKDPADQAPAQEIEQRMTAMMAGLSSMAGRKERAADVDRVLRQGIDWTAQYGDKEAGRRMAEAFKTLAEEGTKPAMAQ